MIEGLPLFAAPPAAQVDTSQEAAASLQVAVSGLRWRVLVAVIAAADGLTCEEAESVLGLKHQTVAARLWELEGKNRKARLPPLVEMSPEKRRTASGCQARVYRATALGIAVVNAKREKQRGAA